ncbi:hypothetical protein LSTR_LSTR002435 [Laodelphax striatellus]|uniref:Integrator complex subunit 7 n=1 Tax=Laodelphax striatellus TaxID=195883 RepID=A0A482X2Z8_LAOST|nr:hypothetical protein LSTR_LSTR002435 [Laodelphax striatellus]
MMLNRTNSFGESGLGEPEQDANSALTELDKGLRSGRVGEQCEAIVRFPRLFEKYPFPILINSSFLKLADVFREGNNFLRLWVLRVCQQSEKHLDKILNVDEFVRRVFSVIHSNDPVARALSLRTLGSMAGIIPERQHVHHSIRRSLDSHDSVEVEAGIQAAMQFAAQSKSFALSMCNKISDMIQGIETPAHMKLQLIPILQHMHHDTSTAAMVRQLCTDLLPKYPAQEFVVTTLNTLTQLTSATLVEIPDQVDLLLTYLASDPRWAIQLAALRGLHQLATLASQIWPEQCINKLVQVARDSPYQKVVLCVLDVLIELTKSFSVCHTCIQPGSSVMDFCGEMSYSGEIRVASKAIQVVTQLVCISYKEKLQIVDVDGYIVMVESLFLAVTAANEDEFSESALRVCLKCAVNLCQCHRPLCPRFVHLIGSCLIESTGTNSTNALLCEALGAIGGLEPRALFMFLPDILDKISKLSDTMQAHSKVMLCTLVFQTLTPAQWTDEAQKAIDLVVQSTNLWASYRLGRSAARYGHFRVCASIMSQLSEQVSSENLHFWLVTLVEISTGEAVLLSSIDLLDRLGQAIVHYSKALAAIKATSTVTSSLIFQAEYIQLRWEMLQACAQLVSACNSLCTAPPPAITAAIVQATRDELQRFGHITNQLRKSAKEFRAVGEMYWKLYQSAFDADPISLTNLQILQHMCMLMAYQIECVAQPNHQGDEPSLDIDIATSCLETQLMIYSCQAVSSIRRAMDPSLKPITHHHIEVLTKQVEILIKGPLCLPRYFFQVLQSTSVKLAVSPQPRVNGEWISVPSGSQLAVKVEGVIVHGTTRRGPFRSVEGVVLNLNSQQTVRPTNHEGKIIDNNISLRQSVVPHRDFFTAQFLLALSGGGQHQVVVEAAVVDRDANIWNTGPRTTLAVKSHEDANAARARTNF